MTLAGWLRGCGSRALVDDGCVPAAGATWGPADLLPLACTMGATAAPHTVALRCRNHRWGEAWKLCFETGLPRGGTMGRKGKEKAPKADKKADKKAEKKGKKGKAPAPEPEKKKKEGDDDDDEEEEEDLLGDNEWAKTSEADFSNAVDDMFGDILAMKAQFEVRDRTTWTILQKHGPDHLGLRYNVLEL